METFSFKSHPFTMSSFKDFAVALVASSESLMMSLLDSLDIVALDARIAAALSLDKSEGWFKDMLRDEDPGYSFLSDERNGFARYEDALMDHMCRKGSSLYAVHTPEGIQFKPNALLSFIDDVDDLVEHLFAALNFTWAGAARGTEIEDIRYRNGHSPRNLYFTNGVLTFVTFYNKTQHNAGRKSMIPERPSSFGSTFYPPPCRCIPLHQIHSQNPVIPRSSVLYNSCIFVHRARPLNTERMNDPGDTPSLYRILDGLWGHSSKVSQAYYAVEEDTFSHIDAKDVTKAQVFSLAYHEWLGIGYEHLPANLRVGHAEQDKALTQIPPGKIDTAAFVQSLHATIPILGEPSKPLSPCVHTYMAMHAIQPRPPPLHSLHVSTSSRVIVHPSANWLWNTSTEHRNLVLLVPNKPKYSNSSCRTPVTSRASCRLAEGKV
ncbi:hypothetical protein IMY05_C4349000100 [Salix suchowensis]|nr:hypothetical protein IMY05_C4349000100 [Salix suchowensis]